MNMASSDHDVAVLRFDDLNGVPLAVLMNYAVQSSVMDGSVMEDGGKLITPDLGGAAAHYVEQQYGDNVVAVFTTGAAGDQSPFFNANRYTIDKVGHWSRTDIHDTGYILVDLLGELLGSEVVRVTEQIHGVQKDMPLQVVNDSVRCQGQVMPKSIADIRPTTTYEYQLKGDIDVPIAMMQIGDIALAGVQVELSGKTGMTVKEQSPFENTGRHDDGQWGG